MQNPSNIFIESKSSSNQREQKKTKEPLLIMVIANKGGVGKTTSTYNMGFLLANNLKANVLMVDADPQCNLTNSCLRRYFLREDEKERLMEQKLESEKNSAEIKENKERLKTKQGKHNPQEFGSEYTEEDDQEESEQSVQEDNEEVDEEISKVAKEQEIEWRISRQFEKFYKDDELFVDPFERETQAEELARVRKQEDVPISNFLRLLTLYEKMNAVRGELRDRKVDDLINNKVKLEDLVPYYMELGKDWAGGKLLLLPGSMDINQFDQTITGAYHAEKNTNAQESFFSATDVIRKVAINKEVDIVLIDVNPGNTPLNHSLWSGSDYFMIPIEPTSYSAQSIGTISRAIVSWTRRTRDVWTKTSRALDENLKLPQFLGVYVQKIRYRSDQPAGTYPKIALMIKRIASVVREVLLKKLKEIGYKIVDETSDWYKLGKIIEFDQTLGASLDKGFPIAAYEYYYDAYNREAYKKTDNFSAKEKCVLYQDEFLVLIDLLLGRKLLKSDRLSVSIQDEFTIPSDIFVKNFKALRRQLLSSYKQLPHHLKLTKEDESFMSHALYDYGADDVEKALFALRQFKSCEEEAPVFIGYPACSIRDLEALLKNQFLVILQKWRKRPQNMIFVVYENHVWHTIRIFFKNQNGSLSFSVLTKSPDGRSVKSEHLENALRGFITELYPQAEISEPLDYLECQGNQLGGMKTSAIATWSNVQDLMQNRDNHDFIAENQSLFFIENNPDKKRLLVARRNLNAHIEKAHDWFKQNELILRAKEEVKLLQQLSKKYYQFFLEILPKGLLTVEAIYRALKREHRFIPDSVVNKHQLVCLMMFFSEIFKLRNQYRQLEKYNIFVKERDKFIQSFNTDQILKGAFGFGKYINWFKQMELNSKKKELEAPLRKNAKLVSTYVSQKENRVTVWQELQVPDDNNCGFEALGLKKEEAVDILLAQGRDEKTREDILLKELIIDIDNYERTPKGLQGKDPLDCFKGRHQSTFEIFCKKYKENNETRLKLYEKIRSLLNSTNAPGLKDVTDDLILSHAKGGKLPASAAKFSAELIKAESVQAELKQQLISDEKFYEAYINSFRNQGVWPGQISLKKIAKLRGINLVVWKHATREFFDFTEIIEKERYMSDKSENPVINVIVRGGRFNFLVEKTDSDVLRMSSEDEDVVMLEVKSEPIERYIAFDAQSNQAPLLFDELPISGEGGRCGFRSLGISPAEGAKILKSKAGDEKVRELILCEELLESLDYHFRPRFEGEGAGENPPTRFMDEKMQLKVVSLYSEIKECQKNVGRYCDEIRNKTTDELKDTFLPNSSRERTNEKIIERAKKSQFPMPLRELREKLLAEDKKLDQLFKKLRDDTSLYLAYVSSYSHEPAPGEHGLWLGKHSMNIIAQEKNIRLHVWGVSTRECAGYRIIEEDLTAAVGSNSNSAIHKHVFLRHGHYNILSPVNITSEKVSSNKRRRSEEADTSPIIAHTVFRQPKQPKSPAFSSTSVPRSGL